MTDRALTSEEVLAARAPAARPVPAGAPAEPGPDGWGNEAAQEDQGAEAGAAGEPMMARAVLRFAIQNLGILVLSCVLIGLALAVVVSG